MASRKQRTPSIREHKVSPFESYAIERLKERGYRITAPRLQVIRALAGSAQALSAYGIHSAIVGSGGRIDVVTVYRILTTLSEVHLIHHIGVVDGYLACCMESDHAEQMEHVVCQQCGTVRELQVPQAAIEATEAQLKAMGFDPANIKIEVLGRCTACTAAR